jgi:hypothetical protein
MFLMACGPKRRLLDNLKLSKTGIQKTVCGPNCACVGESKTNCLKYFIVSSINDDFFGILVEMLMFFIVGYKSRQEP